MIASLKPQHTTQELLQQAMTYLGKGHYSDACALLEELVSLEPESTHLWKTLGMVYQELCRYTDAMVATWTAFHINQSDDEAEKLQQQCLVRVFIMPDEHPESASLHCLCNGHGIEVGCGHRKTHPDAIGVDLLEGGKTGEHGVVKDLPSVADICASGDDMTMFKNNELDFVINRHVLEHFQDPLKAIEEWKRILKPGGLLGIVTPDDRNCDTIALDPTHKHVFTPDSFKRLMRYMGGFNEIYVGDCLKDWSFVAIYQKKGGDTIFPYHEKINQEAIQRCRSAMTELNPVSDAQRLSECKKECQRIQSSGT